MTKARSKPLFSVHCAAYNSEQYVEECVRSVLTQTIDDIEMVVVEDGSSDGTLQKLMALQEQDVRLRVFRHESGVNRGQAMSERLAVQRSSAPFLARIDSDDRWAPDKLEKQLPSLEAGALLCYGRVRVIDEQGQVRTDLRRRGVAPQEAVPGVTAFESLLVTNYIPALTAVFPREAYERVGGYSLLTWEDWALWARLIALEDPVFIDDVLGDYRLHPAQVTEQVRSARDDIRKEAEVVDSLLTWADLPTHLRPAAESFQRCYRAMLSLADDGPPDAARVLQAEDAARAALVFGWRFPLLSMTYGRVRVFRWVRRLIAAGGPFRRHIGAYWNSYLKDRVRSQLRQRRYDKTLTYAIARLILQADLARLAAGDALRRRSAVG
jgi:glycosyltransferase involved in cell wall biosynthesis